MLFATGDCGYVAALYAATRPGRIAGLVLYGASPTEMRSEDTPWGITEDELETASRQVRDELGSGTWTLRTNPTLAGNDHFPAWAARYERLSLAPGSVYHESMRFGLTDLRGILPTILVPTLVLHRTDDPEVPVEAGRYLAAEIPGARFAELAGVDHFPWVGDQDSVLREIDTFIDTIRLERTELDRVLATVLFTDIVGSTRLVAELGDRAWTDMLERHRRVIRSLLDRYQGREVGTTGDGFLATFDGPARAVRCALAAVEAVRAQGVEIRAGCHTGEIEMMDDGVGGIAVHIAARVSSLAGANEVLVSRTVRDLVVGSGLHFDDRGVHALKGVPEPWHVFTVAARA